MEKFATVVGSLTDHLVLIGGDSPVECSETTKWIRTLSTDSSSSSILRTGIYLMNQILASLAIARQSFREGTKSVIFLAPAPMPIVVSKLVGLQAIRFQGGSYSRQLPRTISRAKRAIMIAIFEKLPDAFFDTIVVESPACIDFPNLRNYEKKIKLGALYVDVSQFFPKKRLGDREAVVGYVGGIDENKGAVNFALSLQHIRTYLEQSGTQIVIAGTGTLLGEVKRIVNDGNLPRIVRFEGWVQRSHIPNLLNDLRLLVVPSYSEGLPNILLEAMACGTPVLAARVGAISDVVKDGATGFLMEDNSPECIARGVEMSLRSERLEEVTSNALRLVLDHYRYEHAIERWKEILTSPSI